jgi:hypothetical protein
MVAELIDHQHPIVACAENITEALSEVVDVQPVYMSMDDKRRALLTLTRAERRLAELKLRVLAAAKDVAEEDGARDVAAWIAPRTHADWSTARREQRLALAVDTKWHQVAAGMAAGVVSTEQARVIVDGLDALPERVGTEVLAKAEAQLVEWAAEFGPKELRRLARRILEVVAPDIAEAEEAKRLEEEEKQAREDTRITSRSLGNGSVRGTIVTSDATWGRFMTYLESFTSPRKQAGAIGGEEDQIPYPRRLGRAFTALLEHLDPKKLPEHGGDATTVLVTLSLDALRADLAVAGLIDGEGGEISASEARRLACIANIIPVVLGGQGEILDLGRTRRLASPAQRKALALRDQKCRAEGCTVPARWCEAHHLKSWAAGGKTNLKDLVLECNHHHHLMHDPTYSHEILPNGDIRFHRRT